MWGFDIVAIEATIVFMEPASTIIKLFGGPSKVAKIASVHRVRVSNWMRPKSKGGTGGRIPQAHIPVLLAAARERGIDVSAEQMLSATPIAGDAA